MLTNYHLLTVTKLRTKIKISSDRFQGSIYLNYQYIDFEFWEIVLLKLREMGFNIIGKGYLNEGKVIFISTTFKPLKK